MKGSRLSQAQTDHLLGRLKAVESAALGAIPRSAWEIPVPPKVLEARILREEWDNYRGRRYKAVEETIRVHTAKEQKSKDRAQASVKNEAEKIRTIVLFKDPDTALAAVEAYEKAHR